MKLIVFVSLGLLSAISMAAAGDKMITILATNDIHGGVESARDKASGQSVGGMAMWSGIVRAIREGAQRDGGGVVLVDAGDQFQGTLISNYNEGSLVVGLMKKIGYDAIVPGNHDFDFGPRGWLVDQSSDPTKRREVLEGLIRDLDAPMLSGNDFYKTYEGAEVDDNCRPTPQTKGHWRAVRPNLFAPSRVVNVAGVRVALIGLDNFRTTAMTTKDNVADLCFADELASYREIRRDLVGKADVFVLVMHDGDANNDHGATKLAEAIGQTPDLYVDAIVSGHTHYTYQRTAGGVPMIQSGANGLAFGRIDLVYNENTRRVTRRKAAAGVKMFASTCDKWAKDFCKVVDGKVQYDGVTAVPDAEIAAMLKHERERLDKGGAKAVIGHTEKALVSDRIDESPAIDFFSDAMLAAARLSTKQVDVAFYNTGGVRDTFAAGDVTYEDLFRALPFNNRGWALGPMSTEKVLQLLRTSIKTCGKYGAIIPSGLRVKFSRDCGKNAGDKPVDPKAELVSVITLSGKVLFPGTPQVESLVVATVDFLATGGEGGEAFAGVPRLVDFGIAREAIKDLYKDKPFHLTGAVDGRWENVTP